MLTIQDEQMQIVQYPSVDDLRESRAKILSAQTPDILRQEISLLEATLKLMSERTSGEIRRSVDSALEVLASFKMHDKTRNNVACYVQTVICNMINEK